MKFLIVALFAVGLTKASVIPIAGQIEQDIIPGIASENLVQGPSTITRVIGPDGSQISADAPGGRIIKSEDVIVPVIEPLQPVISIARSLEPVAVVAAVPVLPAGVVAALPAVPAPVITTNTIVKPEEVVVETEVASDDTEGEYVPDNNEKLYDDGSYKSEATTEEIEASDDGSYKGE